MGAPTWPPNPQRSEPPGKPVPLLDPPPTLGAPRPSRGTPRYSDRLLELDGQESAAQRPRHRLRAARRLELRQDRGDVKLHRVARDGQARGDDPVVGAVGHQLENLTLPRGQWRSRGRGAGRRRRQGLLMDNEETGAYGAHGTGELLRRCAQRERRAQSARAGRGCPGAGGILGERDDRRAPRPGGKGSQHPARLGIGEHEGDDGFRVLVQTACQLPRPADLDSPAREIVQRGLDPGGAHGVARHDDHGPGLRVAHVTLAAVEATKRRTSLIGIASARPPAIIVLIPATRPAVSARGPPEFPGARRTSAWIQRRPPGRAGASAWTTPAVSVRGRPSGWPRATTRAPTRNASESASSAGATPER